MGSFYSRAEDAKCSLENGQNSSSMTDAAVAAAAAPEEQTGSIYDLDPLSQEVVRYETEFRKTYRGLSSVLESMEEIPCRRASFEIVSCLRENPKQMGKCMSCMSAYQMCVREATKDKLNQFAYEIKT